MSFKAFVWAWGAPVEKAEHLLVLLALADIANDAGEVRAGAPFIARKCRREERAVRRTLGVLEEAGLISITDRPGRVPFITVLVPDEFTVRFTKDQEREIGKRGRPRKPLSIVAENPGHDGDKPPATVSDEPILEPEDEPKRANALVALAATVVAESDPIVLAFQAYNLMANACGLPRAAFLTDKRRALLRKRLSEVGEAGWRQAMDSVPRTAFLTGSNDRGWKADLDFLLQPTSLQRVLEGFYEGLRHAQRPDSATERREAERRAMFAGAQAAADGGGRRRWRL